MAVRDELLEALKRARETAGLTRAMARQMSVRQLRDTLLLEAVALESVLKRVEMQLETAEADDLTELLAEIERAGATIRNPADFIDN